MPRTPDEDLTASLSPLLIHSALLFFGVVKIFVGLSRNRPVEYLVLTCIALFIRMLVFEFALKNQRGERYIQHITSRRRYGEAAGDVVLFAGLAMAVALYGAGELPYEVRPLLQPPASDNSGGSSCGSSGDSGGGCGGGGGGD